MSGLLAAHLLDFLYVGFGVGACGYMAYRWAKTKSGGMDVPVGDLTFRFEDNRDAEDGFQGSLVSVRESVSSAIEMLARSETDALTLTEVLTGDPSLDELYHFAAADPARFVAALTPTLRDQIADTFAHRPVWLASEYRFTVPGMKFASAAEAEPVLATHHDLLTTLPEATEQVGELGEALLERFNDDEVEGVRREAAFWLATVCPDSPELAQVVSRLRIQLSLKHRLRVIPALGACAGEELALEALADTATTDAEATELAKGLASWRPLSPPLQEAVAARVLGSGAVLRAALLQAAQAAAVQFDDAQLVALAGSNDEATLGVVAPMLGASATDETAEALETLCRHWDESVARAAIKSLSTRRDVAAVASMQRLAGDGELSDELRALLREVSERGQLSLDAGGTRGGLGFG